MKTMSQVSRMADCPETMEEAREFIDQLQKLSRKACAQNSKLRETGNALRDYLTAKVGPIEDIPDEIFVPFCEALK